MSDFGLFWDSDLGSADLRITANDFAADAGLETAVLLSLYTNRRAEDGDVIPDGSGDAQGWWADALPAVEGDRFGSRLWLLARSKEGPEVVARAKEYAAEALAWLVEDKVAAAVNVTSEIVSPGVLGLLVQIDRPGKASVSLRYSYVWAAQELKRGG